MSRSPSSSPIPQSSELAFRDTPLSSELSSYAVVTPQSWNDPESIKSPISSASPLLLTWRPARKRIRHQSRWAFSALSLRLPLWIKLALLVSLLAISSWLVRRLQSHPIHGSRRRFSDYQTANHILHPSIPWTARQDKSSPEEWLRKHASIGKERPSSVQRASQRPKAAIISLVRNEELDGILQSMRQLEYRWNMAYQYPWMFFSEQPFNNDFKAATSNATSAETSYHLIPQSHWSTPDWIDMDRYMDSLDYLSTISVGKGYMLSYRNMCRWNSGFFYKHPALGGFDYYWRVEPDVHFFCDIPYDPFAFMAENNLIYGFNMNILDDARSFASLWRKTKAFAKQFPHLVHEDADLTWLIDPNEAGQYNNCQFFSNFEIGDLNFFRGEANEAYFRYLDESGGFYYERFGDAPVHTLSVALFAPKEQVWFFRDIGYQHDIARHCPLEGVKSGRCDCEATGLDENFYKLVPMESPQRKPSDTCIRQWLGGTWLDKKSGWSQEAERALGGDGYGGYIKTGPGDDDG